MFPVTTDSRQRDSKDSREKRRAVGRFRPGTRSRSLRAEECLGPDPANTSIQSLWLTDIVGAVDVKLLASQLVVTTQPLTTVTAGNTDSLTVTAEDPSGNVDPTFDGKVTLVESNGSSVTEAASQGVATFSKVTLPTTAGGYTLTATAPGLSATPALGVNVVAAAASKLVIAQSPTTPVTAGQAFVVKVDAEDKYNNPVLTYSGNVTIALANNPGGSTLGNNSPATAVNGVATFANLTLNNPGTGYTLQATDTVDGLTVTTSGFNVTSTVVNQATQLLFQSQPTTPVLVGSPFSLSVAAFTSGKAPASSYTGTANLAVFIGPPGASLGGNTTAPASGGIASFPSVTLSLPGTYLIEAMASGLSSTYTAAITVLAPPQVQSATAVFTQKTNHKTHKPVGKPVLTGYQFTFDTPMSSSITTMNDYLVQIYVPAKGRGKNAKPAHYQTISGFSMQSISSTTVRVQTGPKTSTTFKNGGRITLIGTGISSAAGVLLGNNVIYTILKGGTILNGGKTIILV